MKKTRPVFQLVLPLLAFGAVWLVLLPFHEPIATWCALSVEEPLREGSTARIVVGLTGIEESGGLYADLSWYDEKRERRGRLSGSGRIPVSRGESENAISLPIVTTSGLRYVSVVIYLSPTGGWADRTLAAGSELVRVRSEGGTPRRTRYRSRRCYTLSNAEAAPYETHGDSPLSALPYHFAGLVCLACGAMSFTAPRRERWLWFLLGALAVAHGFLERTVLASGATNLVRGFFSAKGLYVHHRAIQKIVLGGLAAAGVVAALNAKRISPGSLRLTLRLALCGTVASACASFLRALSYHYTDLLFERRLVEFPHACRSLAGQAHGSLTVYALVELTLSGLVALSAILYLTEKK